MKKLYGQFTEDEKEMINTILQGINTKSVRITFHAKSRMKEKRDKFQRFIWSLCKLSDNRVA